MLTSHGEAVLGKGGRGIVSHFDLTHKDVHFEMGTFSKAFGVMGGHVSGSRDMVNYALTVAGKKVSQQSTLGTHMRRWRVRMG